MDRKPVSGNAWRAILALCAAGAFMSVSGAVIVVDHRHTDVMRIPDPYINQIKTQKKLFTVMGESV